MNYFVKLVFGGTYRVKGKDFKRGQEVSVSKEEYDYLKTVGEKELVAEGNKYVVKFIPRFETREEEPTVEQKVFEEIKDAPDSLKIRKPGPKPKDPDTEETK